MSNYEDYGYVLIEWDASSPDADFYAWRVYRRVVGDASWTLIYETLDDAIDEYRDYQPLSGEIQEWAVVQAALRFGSVVESAYNSSGSYTPVSTHYWLIHPTDNTQNIKLQHVTADEFTEEYEQEQVVVIGRGRHTDFGTRIGFTGTVTASLFDMETGPAYTAREQREIIRAAKDTLDFMYLRNPFGDLWKVSLANIAFSRVAGVGMRENLTVTIPYSEVA